MIMIIPAIHYFQKLFPEFWVSLPFSWSRCDACQWFIFHFQVDYRFSLAFDIVQPYLEWKILTLWVINIVIPMKKIKFLTWPYLLHEAIKFPGRKHVSVTHIGTLSSRQSWDTFFSSKINFRFSMSNNFNLFSLPPVATTSLSMPCCRIVHNSGPAFNRSISCESRHSATWPDSTAIKTALK